VAVSSAWGVLTAGSASAIEMVTVGNAGNAADTTGYGSVGYTYQIGKFEVTAGEYTAFLNAVASTDPYGLYNPYMADSGYLGCMIVRSGSSGSYTYSVAPSLADRPVNYVSWNDAARLANWMTTGDTERGVYTFSSPTTVSGIQDHATAASALGVGTAYFIPTENEWYKAAYYDPNKNGGGPGYWDYPMKSDAPTVPSNAVTDPDGGNNANFGHTDLGSADAYSRTVVGEFENSESAYGTFDQGGNLYEWNETLLNAMSDLRGMRGGSFADSSTDMTADYRSSGSASQYEDFYFGIRLASVPEPGSIALLVSGGLGFGAVWLWRSRKQSKSRSRHHRHRVS